MIDSEIFQTLYMDPQIRRKEVDAINWQNLHWLNTPGPIFAGWTENLGTGQPTAMNHIIGDYNYHEAVFRQPKTQSELEIISLAASYEPCDGYSFVGVNYWTLDKIRFWWSFIGDIASHVQQMFEREISYGSGNPHKSHWNLGGQIKELQLYGPQKAIPDNYKIWLNYYQSGELEQDVQGFAYFLDNGKLASKESRLPKLNTNRQQMVSLEMVQERKLFL